VKTINIFNSLKDKFFNKRSKKDDKIIVSKILNMLDQGMPISAISSSLYNIPEVRGAINFISQKVAQVKFNHVRYINEEKNIINSSFQKILNIRTNKYNNPSIFFQVITTQLLLKNNVFAYPVWNNTGNLEGIYILPVLTFNFKEINGNIYIELFLNSGNTTIVNYDNIIHLQRFSNGIEGIKKQVTTSQTDVVENLKTQILNDSKTSGKVKALIRANMQVKTADVKKRLDEFQSIFQENNLSGFGFLPSEYEIHDIDLTGKGVDNEILNSVVNGIFNYFGINSKIINNSASELEYEQFIDNTVKPIIEQLEQEFTFKLFSNFEISNGNRIEAETLDLEISTLTSKTQFLKEMIYGTVITRNQARKFLKLEKGPKELDKYLENKNFQELNQKDGVSNEPKK